MNRHGIRRVFLGALLMGFAPSIRPAPALAQTCDGACADLPGYETECDAVFGTPYCHGWISDVPPVQERWSVGDSHIPGDPELGPWFCGMTHYWCGTLTKKEFSMLQKSAGGEMAGIQNMIAGIEARNKNIRFELNEGRSAIQVISTCEKDPEGAVVAHVPIGIHDIPSWTAALAVAPKVALFR